MANDQGWQKRTDEWVKATHASRVRKEERAPTKRQREEVQLAELDGMKRFLRQP